MAEISSPLKTALLLTKYRLPIIIGPLVANYIYSPAVSCDEHVGAPRSSIHFFDIPYLCALVMCHSLLPVYRHTVRDNRHLKSAHFLDGLHDF